jgi:sulfate adenylyltransferase subunit 2
MFPGEKTQTVKVRMRSLGCVPCTGAIKSDADTVPKIIDEMVSFRRSERENRVIDHDEEGSMEIKKREGYFYAYERTSPLQHRRQCGRWQIHADWALALR